MSGVLINIEICLSIYTFRPRPNALNISASTKYKVLYPC